MLRRDFSTLCLGLVGAACTRGASGRGSNLLQLVVRTQPFGGDPAPLDALYAAFERAHPGVKVVRQTLPNASDVAHQYFLTALEGGAADFDLFVADVVWIHEFARAGWIADLSAAFPPERMARDFLRSTAESAVFRGKTFAVPYYADVGLLYYRRDLVPSPPTTYAALEEAVLEARVQDRSMQGYLWQGKQYEGLVCNAFEAVWGHGGTPASGETLTVASPEAAAGLETLRGWVERGVSPRSVTSAAEEDTRRAFQQGSAVFQRNWPYAWAEMQKEDSPVCGRVGVAPLPTLAGEPGAGTLGGYQLAVNAHSPPEKRALVTALLAHLTSPDAYLTYALHYGRNPPMRSVYQDPRLRKGAPFTASLLPHLERARARPLTPYYNLISDALQGEFSAAVAGLRSPKEALARAQRRIDHLTKG